MTQITEYKNNELQKLAMDKLKELNNLVSEHENNKIQLYDLKKHEWTSFDSKIERLPVSHVKLSQNEFNSVQKLLVNIFEDRKNKIEREMSNFNVTKNGL